MKFIFFFILLSFKLIHADSLHNIQVRNIHEPYFVEMPNGKVNLKTFRADLKLIQAYSVEHKVEEGQKKDFEKAPNCTRAEIHALKSWTGSMVHKTVNRKLRNLKDGKVDGKPLELEIQRQILMIASGINCAPQFEGEVVRIEDPPDHILAQYELGADIVVKGFTGTTKGSEPAKSMLNEVKTKQTILIFNGKGADIDLMDIATWKKEREVLIAPGTIFRVVSVEEDLDIPKPSNSGKVQHKIIFDQLN
jgi:hypothetical protein